MTRILWLAHRDPEHPKAGGAERSIFELGGRLTRAGHTVTVWCAQPPGRPLRTQIAGMHVQRCPSYLLAHAALPLYLARQARSTDVVIDDLGHVVPWGASAMVFRTGIVYFRHLHARTLPGQVPYPFPPILSSLEHLYPLLYRDREFVTESMSSQADLARLGVKSDRVHRIPPGVDLEAFRPGSRTPFPQLVYFGGFRRSKRPDHALLVLRDVLRVHPDARLVMIGAGPSLCSTIDRASALGLGSSVSFRGRVDRPTLAQLAAESWVNLHPAVAEGWGCSIVEASAAGVPTVGYQVPGVSESISNGTSGILVPDSDPGAMADAVMKILDQYPGNWSQNSRKWAKSFSWDVAAAMWNELLQDVS